MKKKSKLVSYQSHALYQQDRFQAQEWILGKENEAVASAPFFRRYRTPLLRALHHCLVEKVMYHSRTTFKEALKQVVRFSK